MLARGIVELAQSTTSSFAPLAGHLALLPRLATMAGRVGLFEAEVGCFYKAKLQHHKLALHITIV